MEPETHCTQWGEDPRGQTLSALFYIQVPLSNVCLSFPPTPHALLPPLHCLGASLILTLPAPVANESSALALPTEEHCVLISDLCYSAILTVSAPLPEGLRSELRVTQTPDAPMLNSLLRWDFCCQRKRSLVNGARSLNAIFMFTEQNLYTYGK